MATNDRLPDGYYKVVGPNGLYLLRNAAGKPTLGTPDTTNVGAIYMLGSGSDDDYALWTPHLNPNNSSQVFLTAANSFNLNPSAPHEVVNVAGYNWTAGSTLITWEWSGGKPNEVWAFQSCDKCGVLDQQVPRSAEKYGLGDLDQWQSFMPGFGGKLSKVDFFIGSPRGDVPCPGAVLLYEGEGTAGTLLAELAVVFKPWSQDTGKFYQTFEFPAPVAMPGGAKYTLRLRADDCPAGWIPMADASDYPRGRNSDASYAWIFKTWMQLSNA